MRLARTLALLLCLCSALPLHAEPSPTIVQAEAAMQRGDYAIAYCLWVPLAQRGNANAQYSLGWMYHNGYGLTINDRQALKWWKKAAAQRHQDARFALGNLYRQGGRGVKPNPRMAVVHLLEAMENGHRDAKTALRMAVARGEVDPRQLSPALGAKLTRLAGKPQRIKGDRVNLRAGPGTQHGRVARLDDGATVAEIGRRGVWVKVRIGFGERIAWVHRDFLRRP